MALWNLAEATQERLEISAGKTFHNSTGSTGGAMLLFRSQRALATRKERSAVSGWIVEI